MSGEQVIIVPGDDEPGAEFAAGVAVATADQAVETASSAEHTAELALQVAQDAAQTAHVALGAVDNELEDDVPNEEFQAFQEETRAALAAIADRLDQADAAAAPVEEPAGPPAPPAHGNEHQDDGPVATPEKDGNDDGTPAEQPAAPTTGKKKRTGYGAQSWWGADE